MAQHETQPMWWDARKEPVQICQVEIPVSDPKAPKKKKVRKSCGLMFCGIMLRIIGIAIAVGTLAYGGWTFYQIPQNLGLTPIVKVIAQGAFLCFIGILTLFAETRTRRTMHGCMDTYILFASYLARGLLYTALGAVMFALKFDPPYIKRYYLAGAILAGGILNLVYYPFYWKYLRRKQVSRMHEVQLEPYPEEIIYGLNTEYIKNETPATPLLGFNASNPTKTPANSPVGSSASDSPTGVGAETPVPVSPRGKGKAIKRFDDEITVDPPLPVGIAAC